MIRYYEIEDIKEIAKIIVDDWKDAYKGIIDDGFLESLNYKQREEKITKGYEKEKSIVYVKDNEILGYCRFGESRDNLQGYGEIIALYVKKDCKRKRYRRKIIK